MKIDNNAQLQSFIKTLGEDIYAEELKVFEQEIDIERFQIFSKKTLLLQWYFNQELTAESYESDSHMYHNALDEDLKNGLIQGFSIELNIGYFKDYWGKDRARSEMIKLAKDGFLIRKDIKNYSITPLGEVCPKFIYFKFLEEIIGVQKLWKLMKLDLTKDNLQNIDPKITIEDLESRFIVIKGKNKFTFHAKFEELIEFIKNPPEFYPKEFQIFKENLSSWIANSLIREFDKKLVRFTISGKNLHYFKNKLDKIFYEDNEIFDVESLFKKRNDFTSVAIFFTKLIGASLSIYNTNEFLLKNFFSVLKKSRILLIMDG